MSKSKRKREKKCPKKLGVNCMLTGKAVEFVWEEKQKSKVQVNKGVIVNRLLSAFAEAREKEQPKEPHTEPTCLHSLQ